MSNAAFTALVAALTITASPLAAPLAATPVAGRTALPSAALAERGARRHLRLLRSFPAADTVLASSPDALRLWLSESAELLSTRVTLLSAAGKAVSLAKPTKAKAKGAPVEVLVPSRLAPGAYTVSWRTMSKDGHVVKGTFVFTVTGAR